MSSLANRMDAHLLIFLGLIAVWAIIAGGVQTPASEISELESSTDPSTWVEALTSPDRTVRNHAREHILDVCSSDALGRYAMESVNSPDRSNQEAALWLLARIDVPGRGLLASGLIGNEHASLREAALAVLAEDPVPEAHDILVSMTEDPDISVQATALSALSALGDPDDLHIFIDFLGSPRTSLREAANNGILAITPISTASIPSLLAVAQGSDLSASREAVRLLGEIGDPDALDGLFVLFETGISGVASEAAIAIGKIGGEYATEKTLHLFRTGQTRVRAQAARTLGELGTTDAVDDLWDAVRDKSEDVWVRYYSMHALATCGDRALIPGVLELLNDLDNDPRLIKMGIEALGGIGGDEVLEIYDQIIAGEEDFGLDRMDGQSSIITCIAGLGRMDSDGSRERLRSILENAEDDNLNVIIGVVRALGNVGIPEDIDRLQDIKYLNPVLERMIDEAIEAINARFP